MIPFHFDLFVGGHVSILNLRNTKIPLFVVFQNYF